MTQDSRDLRDERELRSEEQLEAAEERDRTRDDSPAQADERAQTAHVTAAETPGGPALLADQGVLIRRWDEVQATFVDDPHGAVTAAGALVEDVLSGLSNTFAAERDRVEAGEQDGEQTENLRMAMQQYREFFRRLLAA